MIGHNTQFGAQVPAALTAAGCYRPSKSLANSIGFGRPFTRLENMQPKNSPWSLIENQSDSKESNSIPG